MKLSQVLAKLTGRKAKALSTVGGLAIAGMALTAAAPAAKAQVAFGVEIGGPRYYAPAPRPVYVAPGYAYGYGGGYDTRAYWEHRRYEDYRAHEWREHEFQERNRDFYRDRDRDHGSYGRGWR